MIWFGMLFGYSNHFRSRWIQYILNILDGRIFSLSFHHEIISICLVAFESITAIASTRLSFLNFVMIWGRPGLKHSTFIYRFLFTLICHLFIKINTFFLWNIFIFFYQFPLFLFLAIVYNRCCTCLAILFLIELIFIAIWLSGS